MSVKHCEYGCMLFIFIVFMFLMFQLLGLALPSINSDPNQMKTSVRLFIEGLQQWMCKMNRILVLSDDIDHLLSMHHFQACESVRHVDPVLDSISSRLQLCSCRLSFPLLWSTRSLYPLITYRWEVGLLSLVLFVGLGLSRHFNICQSP